MDQVFVGRKRELAILRDRLEAARSGNPTTVLVDGGAGFGKTVLLQRFLEDAGDGTLLPSSGDEAERALPYGVLGQLLAAAGDAGTQLGRELRSRTPSPDPLATGARLLDVLGQAQDDGVVIVVVDDAHWADTPSLRALAFAARRLLHDRVMTIISMRDAADRSLPDGLRRLVERQGMRMTLEGLGADDLRRLAMEAGGISLTRQAAQRLREHTGGNPLHARALLKEVPGEVLADRRRSLPAPASFTFLVLDRLVACSPSAERLAAAAAVLGDRSPLATALAVGGVEEPLACLEELTAAGILTVCDQPDGTYAAFTHPLVRSAVYGGVGAGRRSELHGRAAELTSGATALDHRLAAAVAPDPELVTKLVEAADHEAARGSWIAAADHLLGAAGLSPADTTRARLILDAMDYLLLGGEVGAAAALAARVKALSESARSTYLLGHLVFLNGQHREAKEHLSRAWSLHNPTTERELSASIANLRALLSVVEGRGTEAVEWGRRALAAGGAQGLIAASARTHAAIGAAISGHPEEGLELLAAAPDGLPGPERLAVLSGRGTVELWVDELEAARSDLTRVATPSCSVSGPRG